MRAEQRKFILRYNGGKGSGDFGHAGRPGKVGGSAGKVSKSKAKKIRESGNKQYSWLSGEVANFPEDVINRQEDTSYPKYFSSAEGQAVTAKTRELLKKQSDDGKTVVMYRGIRTSVGKGFTPKDDKFTSWTTEPEFAEQFASGELANADTKGAIGVVVKARIPISAVYASPETYYPFSDEHIFGGLREHIVKKNKKDVFKIIEEYEIEDEG